MLIKIKPEVENRLFVKFLKTKSIKQVQIAKALDISQQLVSKWCKGKCEPSLNAIIKMSETFGIPIEEIVLAFKKN
ncbi:MAG TPA: hypothetical protein DD621_05420 [Clostridiales bacterium]|nr:hypothetical protein [Clostridiales bacterium]